MACWSKSLRRCRFMAACASQGFTSPCEPAGRTWITIDTSAVPEPGSEATPTVVRAGRDVPGNTCCSTAEAAFITRTWCAKALSACRVAVERHDLDHAVEAAEFRARRAGSRSPRPPPARSPSATSSSPFSTPVMTWSVLAPDHAAGIQQIARAREARILPGRPRTEHRLLTRDGIQAQSPCRA